MEFSKAKKIHQPKSYLLFGVLSCFLAFIYSSCSPPEFQEPEFSLDSYEIEPGFKIEVIASEPLLHAPVAMDFDEKGRIWVVEMNGYMPNIDGEDEEAPTGRIVILEDLDGDGRMDHSKVFLDGLVLPRAMLLVYGGVLYSEPPNLWFVSRNEDQPGKRQLVDNQYAIGGNVEHQPNGLTRHLDNWIYSSRSTARYKKVGNRWIKEVEPLRFRGQWGLTFDDYGRLFYNDNSNPLYADLMRPGILSRNKNHTPKKGVFEWIMSDRRVWPLHATAINRGYIEGNLDSNEVLKNFTSACGPVIYRGDQFPQDFKGNAFVCGPEGNLIKRYLLTEKDNEIVCNQAYEEKEFLASTDEGFRPVNLYNSPDGCLYAVDFHRGIIQHRIYMTAYLREKILEKKLDTIVDFGRILRISNTKNPIPEIPDFSTLNSNQLVPMLGHSNGWMRDKAQQFLIERNAINQIEQIEKMAFDNSNPLGQIHAIWTLKGMGKLDTETLALSFRNAKINVQSLILWLARPKKNQEWDSRLLSIYSKAFEKNQPETDLMLCAVLGNIAHKNPDFAFRKLSEILAKNPENQLFHEAAMSGLEGLEEQFLEYIKTKNINSNQLIINYLEKSIQNIANPIKPQYAVNPNKDGGTTGLALYRKHCESCHGLDGSGIPNLAPPLQGSDWVEGDPRKLILITLHGLSGPIHVNEKLYTMNNVMPGIKDHPELSDKKIANLLSFVRNSFGKEPVNIKPELIQEMKKLTPEGGIFTEKSVKDYLKLN